MSSSTRIIRYHDGAADEWSLLVAESPDAWFWHTRTWLEFAIEIGREHYVDDVSFLITLDNAPAAVCPVVLESRDGYRRFSYMGEFIPFPAIRRHADAAMRSKVIDIFAAELEALAAKLDVAYARIAVPALAPQRLAPAIPAVNPLIEHGFTELGWQTQVIDLTRSIDDLWKGLRKGHRSDVKRAASAATMKFWHEGKMPPGKFMEYRALHAKDAGRVTRSARSFDLMEQWVRNGHAVLAEAAIGNRAVAFALLMLFGTGAYYGSGCKDPGESTNASHLIQWESMRWLKDHGYTHYDIGVQHFGPQLHHVPSDKEIGISSFKRGFGGTTMPVPTAERFYSPAVFEQQWKRRVENALSGTRVS